MTRTIRSVEDRRKDLEKRYSTWNRRTLDEHFRIHCQEYSERPLILTPTSHYTYQETWSETQKLAKALVAMGVKRRDHVGVLMANEPEFVFLMLAISAVGAVCLPFNTMLRQDELAYMVEQSDCKYLIFHQTVGSVNHLGNVRHVLREMEVHGATPLKGVVCIETVKQDKDDDDSTLYSEFQTWRDFVAAGEQISDEQVEERRSQSQYPDEVSHIIYTSGSTGRPKGVMLTHDMFLRCAFTTTLSRAFDDGRRIFTGLPLYHVFALEEGLLAASFVGGCVITAPGFTPLGSLQLMEQYQAEDFLCVPSMLVALLNHPDVRKFDLSSLTGLMCAAAPAPVPVWQAALDILGVTEICTGYGGTEVTASTVHTEVGDPIDRVVSRVGRIKPGGSSGLPEFGGANVQYKVVDPYTGETLPEGSVGELTARGNIVTKGYYRKPEETDAVVDKDGWLRTGDLGRVDELGYIELLGRSKDMYKVSGENVAPKEVEEIISRHPSVNQVYIVGVQDALTTEIGAAFIELKPGATITRREIIRWCEPHVARFKLPRHVFFVEPHEWPMTGTGKIQKFMLKDLAAKRLASDTEEQA